MITPEEVREYLKKYYPNKYLLEFVTQQEKKDRLLGLYKEYFEMCQRGECDWNILRNEIPKQIKTLEEELKND